MSSLQQQLIEFGLSERETRVYLYLLEYLEATAYMLGKELHMPRATVYLVLESLQRKKLVSMFRKNNIRYFTPESVNRLQDILDEQQHTLRDMLPALQGLIATAGVRKPHVRFYEGKDGAKIAWEDMLETYKKDHVKFIYGTSSSTLFKLLPKYFDQWIERRRKLPTKVYLVYPESERQNIGWQQVPDKEYIRFLPDTFLPAGEVTSAGNKTWIFSFDQKEPQSIIIESASIKDILEGFLKLTWETAKE